MAMPANSLGRQIGKPQGAPRESGLKARQVTAPGATGSASPGYGVKKPPPACRAETGS